MCAAIKQGVVQPHDGQFGLFYWGGGAQPVWGRAKVVQQLPSGCSHVPPPGSPAKYLFITKKAFERNPGWFGGVSAKNSPTDGPEAGFAARD